jgi:tetratricopeptide (TPR) repeat protein
VTGGKVLPIPRLPKTPLQGVSANDLSNVERYARQMAALPWGEQPMIASVEEAYPLFFHTVGRVREVTGRWDALSEPIEVFVGLPKPLCYVGAAEVTRMFSYLRGTTSAPVGLIQGLRFVEQAQYMHPDQPDALVARINLLTGYPGEQWIDLAEETLAILKLVAPRHPRLPDAESNLLIRLNRLNDALVCIEQTLANPPTPEEEHVALARKARILDQLKYSASALAAYDVVNQRYPNDPWAWHNKSLLLISMNRLDEAWACNQRALSLMTFGQALKTREGLLARYAQSGMYPPY